MTGLADVQVSESVMLRPSAGLGSFVAGYLQAGVEPAEHAGLPSPYMTLIFTLNEPLTIARHADPRQPGGSFVTLAGGLHTVPALVVHDGWQSGIQVMLSPLGARAILGMPAAELASIDVEGSEIFGALAGEVHERMREAAGWPGRSTRTACACAPGEREPRSWPSCTTPTNGARLRGPRPRRHRWHSPPTAANRANRRDSCHPTAPDARHG